MPVSSTLINQLAKLGITLPAWPEEPEADCAASDWIKRGKAYAVGLGLWRAQLRNVPENTKAAVNQLVHNLKNTTDLGIWDQLVYSEIQPEEQGSAYFEGSQTLRQLISSSTLTPAQLLGIAIELAREQRINEASYYLKQLLEEQTGISALERLELCAEFISSANTCDEISKSKINIATWNRALEIHCELTELLGTAVSEEGSENTKTNNDSQLTNKLDGIINCTWSEYSVLNTNEIKENYMKTWKIEVESYKEIAANEAPHKSQPDYLFVYAGHIRSLKDTHRSHTKLINQEGAASSASIIHTWNTQYPGTISWRGHIQHDSQYTNEDLIESIKTIAEGWQLLTVDKQCLDPRFLNREEHQENKIEGMHYGARFFRFSRLYSICMAISYIEKHGIPNNTKIIILRPDVEFRNELDLTSIFDNEMEKPYFLYNKKGGDSVYKATDCVWFCLASHLKLIYSYLLDPCMSLITIPQKYFLPYPNGCYNKTWSLYR